MADDGSRGIAVTRVGPSRWLSDHRRMKEPAMLSRDGARWKTRFELPRVNTRAV